MIFPFATRRAENRIKHRYTERELWYVLIYYDCTKKYKICKKKTSFANQVLFWRVKTRIKKGFRTFNAIFQSLFIYCYYCSIICITDELIVKQIFCLKRDNAVRSVRTFVFTMTIFYFSEKKRVKPLFQVKQIFVQN